MEPRDFWDRNTVLAEAFCASDERVRQAQSVLNEAQAERSRTLAAFAVTVGRDGTIADLMGLNEREVRSARRAVGRGSARTLAEKLLSHPVAPREPQPQPQPPAYEPAYEPASAPAAQRPPAHAPATPPHAPTASSATTPMPAPMPSSAPMSAAALTGAPTSAGQAATSREEPSATTSPAPPPAASAASPAPSAPPVSPVPPGQPHEPTTSTTGHGAEPDSTVVWSSSMDSVLVWSWKSGLDLQTVAAELGLDVRTLLLRVQVLADDGLLTPTVPPVHSAPSGLTPAPPPAEPRRSGRHRRHHEEAYAAFFSPTTTFPTYVQH